MLHILSEEVHSILHYIHSVNVVMVLKFWDPLNKKKQIDVLLVCVGFYVEVIWKY